MLKVIRSFLSAKPLPVPTFEARTVTNNIITDTYANRLGRYFMLTFSLKLSRFAGINVNTTDKMTRSFMQ